MGCITSYQKEKNNIEIRSLTSSVFTIDFEDSVITSMSIRKIESSVDELLDEEFEKEIISFIDELIYEN